MVQWVTCNGWCPNLAKRVYAQPKWSILPELILVSIPSPLPPPPPRISSGFPDKLIYSWVKRGIVNVIKSILLKKTTQQPGQMPTWTSQEHEPLAHVISHLGDASQPGVYQQYSLSLLALENLDLLWYCRLQDLRAEFYLFPQDDEEPQDTKFQIDGSYIPRIFILGE